MEILERKITVTEMKNSLVGHNSTFQLAKERVNELDDRLVEITQKNMKKNNVEKNRLRKIWEAIKCANMLIIGVSKGEEKEK